MNHPPGPGEVEAVVAAFRGTYMNANNGNNPPLWADLVEKAYAQLSSTGAVGHPAVNSYENIDGKLRQLGARIERVEEAGQP